MWDAYAREGRAVRSRLTLLLYLNDDFEGGETVFYEHPAPRARATAAAAADAPRVVARVAPAAGAALCFPQRREARHADDDADGGGGIAPLHAGTPVGAGSRRCKYVMRSDVLYELRPSRVR